MVANCGPNSVHAGLDGDFATLRNGQTLNGKTDLIIILGTRTFNQSRKSFIVVEIVLSSLEWKLMRQYRSPPSIKSSAFHPELFSRSIRMGMCDVGKNCMDHRAQGNQSIGGIGLVGHI
jgi:hypothetical protein